MTDGWTHQRGDRRRVVVIGAGVAGMTAAHELVERGYEVEVVEMAYERSDRDRARLGGMARTSWARVPPPATLGPLRFITGLDRSNARTDPPPPPARIEIDGSPLPLTVALQDVRGESPDVARFVNALRPDDELVVLSSRPLRMEEEVRLAEVLGHSTQVTVVDMGQLPEARVQISVAGARVAGEHGFRFFPSFYRHLFDTMKRIPVPEAPIANPTGGASDGVVLTSDSARSVFDALRSNEVIQLGLVPDGRSARTFEIPRRPMLSPQDLRKLFGDVLERAGYRGQDLHRLVTRYTEYLTSATERRMDYETISWSKFLGLGGCAYSAGFARHVTSGAQALVAMSSDTNDARTIGSIAMQLTLDQVRANPGGYTDATLRGPTSLELFEPWRAFLESQGVVFTRGQLVGFTGQGMAVRPVFGRPRDDRHPEAGLYVVGIDPADYYVIAIPVDRFQALFGSDGQPTVRWLPGETAPPPVDRKGLLDANAQCLELDQLERGYSADPPGERSDDIAKLLAFDLGDVAKAPDTGPLRYMCGIQFYFAADVKVILGHTLCLDSPWGVSYISQSQYWQDRSRGQSGVRGVISAIFTLFQVPAVGRNGQDARTALACSEDQIADRVWKQISDAWDTERHGPLPCPDYYYIDESLRRDPNGTWTNDTPYLVNQVGDWPKRGGLRTAKRDYTYRMQLGHTVFAGAFMRTFTRLNTMEAANESGRHATNAILDYDRDHEHAPLQHAQVWNPEDHELPEVGVLRELDRRILRRGGHHVLRHAGVEAALRGVPWDLVRLFLPIGGDDR